MMFKKAQAGPKELVLTIILAGILFVVGVLIFANVTNTTKNILDAEQVRVVNESVTISVVLNSSDATNSTLLVQKGYITDSEVVKNGTVGGARTQLNRNIDYSIALVNGLSGELTTQGNFTLFNITNTTDGSNVPGLGFNNTLLDITYSRNKQSAAQISTDLLTDNVLDSFELGVISLIVLAAVVILAVLFKLGSE